MQSCNAFTLNVWHLSLHEMLLIMAYNGGWGLFFLVGDVGLDLVCSSSCLPSKWQLYDVEYVGLADHTWRALSRMCPNSLISGLGTFNKAYSLIFVLSIGKAVLALLRFVTGSPKPGKRCPVAIIKYGYLQRNPMNTDACVCSFALQTHVKPIDLIFCLCALSNDLGTGSEGYLQLPARKRVSVNFR